MLKVGITGQAGFIGTHLFNYLSLRTNELILIPFDDKYFQDNEKLRSWVVKCDVILHLAAINRHDDQSVLYNTNIHLVNQLINVLEETDRKPHVIFSSSSQENRENKYGKSKKDGRNLFIKWAARNDAQFTGMIIPNVFGPFGNPYYNSVIATFCHQLTHSKEPQIETDGNLKLIYVQELAKEIYKIITSGTGSDEYHVPHTSEKRVSEILKILENFKVTYFEEGIIPELKDSFEVNLFNTFRSYFDLKSKYPVMLLKKTDERGFFVELAKLEIGGQISFSHTKPGITRGNHFHTRKIERFTVIKGEALIRLRRIGDSEVQDFYLSGDNPSYVDIPIWYTHNIANIGREELLTIFWVNEFYNENDPDTFFETV